MININKYFPFIHKKKEKKPQQQLPLYIDLPLEPMPKTEEDKTEREETEIIIKVF